ncbi:YdcH family protein [Cupriavidus pauculus]|uniref:DUF465 domain-containing protein n=1 Tax=Cupriavidus pauculus TaxID=82633 RepID=A0A2N5CE10_9BURK|nr:DUF465 domain-containing protein [Cupriavidus pauculus]PLQ00438.1 hypothetical protein CYJ10_12510 [Cupriavidus pauculus]
MFPEYRAKISRLRIEDAHFGKLFARHNELDHQIKNMESGAVPASWHEIEARKKQKLKLKDQLYAVLKSHAP